MAHTFFVLEMMEGKRENKSKNLPTVRSGMGARKSCKKKKKKSTTNRIQQQKYMINMTEGKRGWKGVGGGVGDFTARDAPGHLDVR